MLAITRRYSLAKVGEGWSDCHLIYRPASYADLQELRNLDPSELTEEKAEEYQNKFILDRIVSGTVLELDQDAKTVQATFKNEHLTQFPKSVVDDIFTVISAAQPDPKD